jgi:hypothetical protein
MMEQDDDTKNIIPILKLARNVLMSKHFKYLFSALLFSFFFHITRVVFSQFQFSSCMTHGGQPTAGRFS